MSLSAKLRRAPLRVVTGAFIVNSGLGKLKADEEFAAQVHGMAAGTYPFLGSVNPKLFTKGLAVGEVAVGGALLAPFVSPVVAGAALAGFSGALLNVYWQTDGMHAPGDPRPTQQGNAVAKDVWMLGIGAGLIVDGLLEPAHDKKVAVGGRLTEKRHRAVKRARKRAEKANRQVTLSLGDVSLAPDRSTRKKAEKIASKAQKRADKAGKELAKFGEHVGPAASDRAAAVRKAVGEYAPVVAERARDAAERARHSAHDLVDEYGPVVQKRAEEAAKAARDAAKELADEYGPALEKRTRKARKDAKKRAKKLRKTADGYLDDYRPVVEKKAKQARKAAQGYVDEYGPAVEKKAKQAQKTAQSYVDEYGPAVQRRAEQARDAVAEAADEARKAARDAAERAQAAAR